MGKTSNKNEVVLPSQLLHRETDPELCNSARLEALRASGLLDSPAEEIFEQATQLVSRVIQARVGLVSLVTDKRQFFKSQVGLSRRVAAQRQTPLSHSICQHVVVTKAPLVINDTRLDQIAQGTLAIKELNVIAYLGVPLYSSGDVVLGAFCAIDTQPRVWTRDEVATMQDVADMLSREIALRILFASAKAEEMEKVAADA